MQWCYRPGISARSLDWKGTLLLRSVVGVGYKCWKETVTTSLYFITIWRFSAKIQLLYRLALYTWLLVNTTQIIKKIQLTVHISPSIFGECFHPYTFLEWNSVDFFICWLLDEVRKLQVHKFLGSLKKFIRALNFQIHIGIHLNSISDKILYKYMYIGKNQFPYIYALNFFNMPLFLWLQTPYIYIWD